MLPYSSELQDSALRPSVGDIRRHLVATADGTFLARVTQFMETGSRWGDGRALGEQMAIGIMMAGAWMMVIGGGALAVTAAGVMLTPMD